MITILARYFVAALCLLLLVKRKASVVQSLSQPPTQKRRYRGVFPFWRITGDASPYEYPSREISFRQEWTGEKWPFVKNDFARIDYYNDGIFYSLPRLVYHVDEPAVCALTQHYRRSIPPDSDLLDICSSWASHYPTEFPDTMKSIRATGMNALELFFNDQLTDGFVVADLNGSGITNQVSDPNVADANDQETVENNKLFGDYEDESVDVITCALSIDYLIDPLRVLRGCNRLLRPGGKVIVSFSNRCFGTKAIRVWRNNRNSFHLELINAFFQYAGNYEPPKAYDITPKLPEGENGFGFNSSNDPLFVVEAIKKSTRE
jgi:SAM-dependent methyltransferase